MKTSRKYNEQVSSENYDPAYVDQLITKWHKGKIAWSKLQSGVRLHVRNRPGMFTYSHRIGRSERVVLTTKIQTFTTLRGNITRLAGGLHNFKTNRK